MVEYPVIKSWFVRFLRLLAAESPSNRRMVLENCAELLEGLLQDAEAMTIEINRLTERLAQVERERDAMKHDFMIDSCEACKHGHSALDDCYAPWSPCKWEWRGVCPENTKEDTPNEPT